jgi:enoyl-CoA hydratase/carnithine racemase
MRRGEVTGESLLLEVAERVATITLNRPEARNALNGELIEALRSAVTALRRRRRR